MAAARPSSAAGQIAHAYRQKNRCCGRPRDEGRRESPFSGRGWGLGAIFPFRPLFFGQLHHLLVFNGVQKFLGILEAVLRLDGQAL